VLAANAEEPENDEDPATGVNVRFFTCEEESYSPQYIEASNEEVIPG